jgi:hypothetical protein
VGVYYTQEVRIMTQIEMRRAKAELHKTIVDTIISFNPNNTEMDTLWDYVKNLAEIEKTY